eukprot:403342713
MENNLVKFLAKTKVNEKKLKSKKRFVTLRPKKPDQQQHLFSTNPLNNQHLSQDQIKEKKKINKLKMQNDILRDRLKQISLEIDNVLQDSKFMSSMLSEKQKDKQGKKGRKLYLQTLEAQKKISERMLDQQVHEKARIQIRLEQLSNANYLNQLVKNNEEIDIKITEQKALNKKLNLFQKTNGEDLVKYQEKNTDQQALLERKLKLMGEELQRNLWMISEKDRDIKILEEKEMGFIIKQTQVKSRYENLRQIHEIKQRNNSQNSNIENGGIQVTDSDDILDRHPLNIENGEVNYLQSQIEQTNQLNKNQTQLISQKDLTQQYMSQEVHQQNGGEQNYQAEIEAVYKKLLVEKWSLQSIQQKTQFTLKNNEKFNNAKKQIPPTIKKQSTELRIFLQLKNEQSIHQE